MANLTGTADWPGVYQIETTDPVVGGAPDPGTGAGMSNIPHLHLFQRTEFLRNLMGGLGETVGTTTNLNTLNVTRLHYFANTATGRPSSRGGSVLHVEMPSGRAAQEVIDSAGRLFVRYRSDAAPTWGAWQTSVNRTGDAMTGNLDMGQNEVTNVGRVNFGGDDYLAKKDGSGVEWYENSELKARIGPSTYFANGASADGEFKAFGETLWRDTYNPKTLAQDGYQKLQSGLIMQWGVSAHPASANETGVTILFPVTFPNACFMVVATDLSGTFVASAFDAVTIGARTTSSFKASARNVNDQAFTDTSFSWLAMGH